ncbi:MAG: MATE family efflux transporter [Clostridia bacterium]|nr:MATE family efflux transporter [Clostridia bacterium]
MLRSIFSLAWPTMLEQLLGTAVQYIDTAMVGVLGTSAVAAVGATTTFNWLTGSTVSAVGVGLLAFIAQAFGAKQPDKARAAAAQSVTLTLVFGLVFTLLTTGLSPFIPEWMQADPAIRSAASTYLLILYSPMLLRTASIIFGMVLRAAGDTRTPMRTGLIVNAVNVVLNFLLIYDTRTVPVFSRSITLYGAGLGINGAALASAIAYTLGGIIITVKLFRHPDISPAGYSFRPDKTILKPVFRVGIPNMLQRFATSLGYVFFASMINSLGEIATAAHTVANTVESAFYIPGWGMQTAAATLSGNATGADDTAGIKKLTKAILTLEVGLMLVSGGLLFAFAPMLIRLFSKDAEVIALGTSVLHMVAVSEPFYGVPIVLEGILQGQGKTVPPFIYNMTGMWGVRILGTFIATQVLSLGLVAAWGCMIAHNLLLFCLFSGHFILSARRSGRR